MSKKQTKKYEDQAAAAAPTEAQAEPTLFDDDVIAKVSINKYDPFQLKGSIDDECVFVSNLCHN
jgi:hypothetical protein